MLDQRQLFAEPSFGGIAVQRVFRVAIAHPGAAQLGECLRRGRARGLEWAAKLGEGVPQVAGQIEGPTALGDGQTIGDSIRTVFEQRNDFFQSPQVKLAVGTPGSMRAIKRRASTDRDLHIVQPVSLAAVVMHLASCYDAKLQVASNAHESSGESQVPANAIPLQLDEESIFSEQRPTAFGELARRREPCGFEG